MSRREQEMTCLARAASIGRRFALHSAPLLALGLTLQAAGCGPEDAGGVVVKRVEDRAELCGGPAQYGDEGDFVLRSSKVCAVVLDVGHGVSPALWGGALADVDLVRPQAAYRGGNGLDQFFMLLPMVNLNAPHPEAGGAVAWTSPDGRVGAVRVVGRGDRVLSVLNLMDKVKELPAQVEEMLGMTLEEARELLKTLFGVDLDLREALNLRTRVLLSTDYILEEEARYIRVVTTFRAVSDEVCGGTTDADGDGLAGCDDPDCSLDAACPDWCGTRDCVKGTRCDAFFGGCFSECQDGECDDGECDLITNLCVPTIREMKPLAAGTSLLDLLSGGTIDLLGQLTGADKSKLLELLPPLLEQIKEKPGFAAGDMALLGAHSQTFVPGIGYELETQYRLMFLRGRNALLEPLAFDVMAGTADRVSYGYFSKEGEVLFPFSTESLTASITHGLNCQHSTEDDAQCDSLAFARFTRYLAVGEGDVASVAEVMYDVRGTPHGQVTGHVLDGKTLQPLSGVDVFALADPCDAKRCTEVMKGCGEFASYEELAHAARVCSATPELPDGRGMVMMQFRTDRGTDPTPDGSFAGPLTAGTYYLVARGAGRTLSVPAKIAVESDRTVSAALVVPRPGTLSFRVLDHKGQPVAARVTVGHCFPECTTAADCGAGETCDGSYQCRAKEPCTTGAQCDEDEECAGGACRCTTARLPGDVLEELGGGYLSDRKVTMELAPTGVGEVPLPPGRYDVVFSHGIEYGIDAREVEIASGMAAFVDARVNREVDTTGWVSMDQHVHGRGSPDAAVPTERRLDSALCDGLEVVITTDHDYIQTLEPQILQLGLGQAVASYSGLEVTTLDLSHLIAWPLKYTYAESAHGALEWAGMTAGEIFGWARAHGALWPDETLVTLAHPRGGMSSYFDVFAVNPFTLEPEPGTMQAQTPRLAPENLSPAFDLMEAANSKRFDVERMPTYREVFDYNVAMRAALKDQGTRSKDEILGDLVPASRAVVRRMLARTPEEQAAHLSYQGLPRCGLCTDDKGCPEGHACRMLEPELGICMVACDGKTACAGELDCLDGWCGDPDVLPCDAVKGLSDDWLRLFNHGVFKWGVGGSDAHGLANFELGCLRNYVRSDTDSPVAVSLLALEQEMAQGHSFLTYGPFVELTVDGKGPGETVEMGGRKSVELRVRVQAADWFDVSRVELLRNGRIEEAWDVDAQEDGQRLEVPHDGVVVLDAALDVSPAEDSWYVAVVAGLAGRTMQPVYGSLELPPVYLGDLFQAVFGSLPISLPSYMTAPKIPVYYPQFPFAVTNPVILDVDGKDASGCAFTPPEGPPPEWACDYPEDYPAHRIPCVCN